jgi:hypothetical protein
MDLSANNCKSPDEAKPVTRTKPRVLNMELLYDTTLITAAVFVFALFLSATT